MKGRSRSTLFLMEQLVVIAVFAICAAVCVRILFVAHTMTVDSVDTRHALVAAENAAETFKALGSTARVAEILGAGLNDCCDETALIILYDNYWQPIFDGEAAFVLRMDIRNGADVVFADISVSREIDARELISLTAARRAAP